MKILPHVAFMESVQTTETGPLLPSALMPQSWEMTFEWSCVAAPLPRFPPASMSADPSDPPFPLSRPRRKTPGSDFRTFWGYQRPSGFNMDCINLYTVYICIPICHVWIPFRLWSLRASFDIRHILALSLSPSITLSESSVTDWRRGISGTDSSYFFLHCKGHFPTIPRNAGRGPLNFKHPSATVNDGDPLPSNRMVDWRCEVLACRYSVWAKSHPTGAQVPTSPCFSTWGSRSRPQIAIPSK